MKLILAVLFSGLLAFGQGTVPEKEAALGQQLAASFLASNPPIDDAAVQGYLDRLVQKISPAGSDFRVTLIANDPCAALHEVTSLPGGSVFVPAALILAARSESELAGMLAQSLSLLSVEAPRESNGGLIFVNLGCVEHQIGKTTHERVIKADALAIEALSRAGFDPEGLLSYLQRMRKPDRDSRVNAMRLVMQGMPKSEPSANDAEFAAVQEQVRNLTQLRPASAKLPTLWRDGEQH